MKTLLTFWIILLLSNQSFEFGTYVHKRNGKEYTLHINPDSSFRYTRPAMFEGNIVETGRWKVENDALILIDSTGIIYDESVVTNELLEDQNFVMVELKDEENNPLSNIEVALNEDDFYKRTDSNGRVRFEYSDLKKRRINQPDNTIEVIDLKADRWNQSSAVKNIFGNKITVIKDFHPRTEYKSRTRRLAIKKDAIVFPNPSGMNEKQIFEFKRKKK